MNSSKQTSSSPNNIDVTLNREEQITKIISQFCIQIEPFITNDDESDLELKSLINTGINIVRHHIPKYDMKTEFEKNLWITIRNDIEKQEKADQLFNIINYLQKIGKEPLIKEFLTLS